MICHALKEMDRKEETMSDLVQHSYFVLYVAQCGVQTDSFKFEKTPKKNGIILLQRGALESCKNLPGLRRNILLPVSGYSILKKNSRHLSGISVMVCRLHYVTTHKKILLIYWLVIYASVLKIFINFTLLMVYLIYIINFNTQGLSIACLPF